MSEKKARTHNNPSNRASAHSANKKVIFKAELDNPFRIHWPSVPLNLQNTILARVQAFLDGVLEYHRMRTKAGGKRKRELGSEVGPKRKKRKTKDTTKSTDDKQIGSTGMKVVEIWNEDKPEEEIRESANKPRILEHIIFGINEVTKKLELQVQAARRPIMMQTGHTTAPEVVPPPIRIVFACRADLNPPIITDHLPHLIAAYNTVKTNEVIKLVPLPKGAETTLANSLGIRRVAVLAVDGDFPEFAELATLIATVPTLTAPWLSLHRRFIPTYVKQILTSAPKDMKAAKVTRAAGKAKAKKLRKESAANRAKECDKGHTTA